MAVVESSGEEQIVLLDAAETVFSS